MDNGFSKQTSVITDDIAKNITQIDELSYELKIAEVMSDQLHKIKPDDRMSDVVEMFRRHRISGAPVVDNNDVLLGILSIEDVIHCLLNGELAKHARDYMTSSVITITGHDPLIRAVEKFTRTRVGRLPVVDNDGKLIGIITKGDITRGLLEALQTQFQAEEVRRYRASHLFEDINSDRTSLILRYYIKSRDFFHGGSASSHIKRALLRLGATPPLARRCGIAIYEAEMNLIIHTDNGGYIRVEIDPKQIIMRAIDDGPGIPDVSLALKPGYSTATEQVREMGFGAGMGLINIQRCVDEMKLESSVGKGTRLEMVINLTAQPGY
jgi:CBS domain-containing protein/anti-sigma regulatory factor (Ser/Thr protein kinase)